MDNYLPIVCMFVLSLLFAGLSFVASRLLQPRRPTSAKSAPYECGIVPSREPVERFPVRFYIVAMVFIVIDIEIIFLYPWAVIFRQLGTFGLVEMVLFAVAVLLSFIYLIANGALDWGPVKRLRPLPGMTPERTTDTTVRRITQDTGEAA
ncbi:MAG TPA: NADH-quinone oxidoreductase subunit A [Acidimicrobiales bacterium]|nr:NADH-quinone oxidoreductase subunit A [Acidimicrobiales bacterium]